MSPPEPVTVLIPAYNEEKAVYDSVAGVRQVLVAAGMEFEIIVVDDGSRDSTPARAAQAGAKVIRHLRNRGYGAALKTGIEQAKNDIIVITDADGTYPAEVLPELVNRLRTADMVVGARSGQEVNIPLLRRPAKFFLKCLAGYITGEKIPDLNSGLRAFRRQCIEQYFRILPDKFSFTTTCTVAMLCDGYRVEYLSINYYRRRGRSKITPWDFINFTTLVLRLSMLFNPLKLFVPAAFFSIALGLLKTVADIAGMVATTGALSFHLLFTREIISASALVFLLGGLQMLLVGMMADGIIRKFDQGRVQKYKSAAVLVLPEQREEDRNRTRKGRKDAI